MRSKGNFVSLLPLSKEEDDLLMRRSKKVKNDSKGESSKGKTEAWPSLGNKGSAFSKGGISFADKLKGNDGEGENSDVEVINDIEAESDDDMSEDEKDEENEGPLYVIEEDSERNFPTFKISDKVKKRLYRAWRKAVIVKLMDKAIGYKALLSRLQTMWAKKCVISLIDIGHGFYVAKLSNSIVVSDETSPEKSKVQIPSTDNSYRDVWKVVQRRQRKPREGKEGPSKRESNGTRFDVLAQMDSEQQEKVDKGNIQEVSGQKDSAQTPLSQSAKDKRAQHKVKKLSISREEISRVENDDPMRATTGGVQEDEGLGPKEVGQDTEMGSALLGEASFDPGEKKDEALGLGEIGLIPIDPGDELMGMGDQDIELNSPEPNQENENNDAEVDCSIVQETQAA
ncbi:hypothetical protein K1719_010345 [Acacia pycnantha]|nr:hypothetical protein K1719_010345 [Acacia pycnantha]